MPQSKYVWTTKRWNGGESQDSRVGEVGAFREGSAGLDVRSDSSQFTCGPEPVLHNTDVTFDALIKSIEVNPTNNDTYLYAGSKIYKETGGVYSLVRTIGSDSPAAQGLCHYNGKLYYRSATQLGQFDYGSTWTDNFQTGLNSCSTFAIPVRFQNFLCVPNGRYLATLDDAGIWEAQRLSFAPDYTIRDMRWVGPYLAVACMKGSSVSDSDEGIIYYWNGTSTNWTGSFPIDGNPQALLAHDNTLIILAGKDPIILESQLAGALQQITIPGVGLDKTAEVYPGAIELLNGLVYFGISDGTSETIRRLVYSWGSANPRFPEVLVPEIPIFAAPYQGTSLQITALKKVGTALRIAWRNGSTYNVHNVDFSTLQQSATYRSLVFDNETPFRKKANKLVVQLTQALRADETVSAKFGIDPYGDQELADATKYLSASLTTEGQNQLSLPLTIPAAGQESMAATDIHFEVVIGGTGSTRPAVKRVYVDIEEDADQL